MATRVNDWDRRPAMRPFGTPAYRVIVDRRRPLDKEDLLRVVVQPTAAPGILGFFAWALAAFVVGAQWADWYGAEGQFVSAYAPLVAGLAQLIAAAWAHRAADGLATAFHGIWGTSWLGYGLMYVFIYAGVHRNPEGEFAGLGVWLIALAVLSAVVAVAAIADNLALVVTAAAAAVAALILGLAVIQGSETFGSLAGWILPVAAIVAAYYASALLLEDAFGRPVLPLFHKPAEAVEQRVPEPGAETR